MAVSITCDSPPTGYVGVAYSHTFPTSGGVAPLAFSISAGALPAGLTIGAGTGIVSGTPTTKGISEFTVTVTDGAPSEDSADCSIRIVGNCLNPD
jgi:hypothetical protein